MGFENNYSAGDQGTCQSVENVAVVVQALRVHVRALKCSSSSAGAQGTCQSVENVAVAVQGLRKDRDETNFLCKIQFRSPLISFVRKSAPVTDFVHYQDQTGRTRPLTTHFTDNFNSSALCSRFRLKLSTASRTSLLAACILLSHLECACNHIHTKSFFFKA